MGKTITVSDEAYNRLKKHKRAGESFSDIINEMIPLPIESGRDFFRRAFGPEAKPLKGGKRARNAP